ncbi:MAG: 5-methylcytosine-specific restriction endonuclease system specificity protein McrC [Cyanobacteriota bacterium]
MGSDISNNLALLDPQIGYIGRIPVCNLWLLMLYASDMFREVGKTDVKFEDDPEHIPELVATILTNIVAKRLKRNLSSGYERHNAILNRIRGKINILDTERHQLLSRGKISCSFDNLSVNTVRNRYVKAALQKLSRIIQDQYLRNKCFYLAENLKQLGVSGEKPAQNEVDLIRYSRNDINDKLMISAAKLAFNLALPTEERGKEFLFAPNREEQWVRRLFEKAIGGFYNVTLSPQGWKILTGKQQNWLIDAKTERISELLPMMRTDITLENEMQNIRIIIDTKFTSIIKPGWFRNETFESKYLYQIYAYLRSQEGNGDPLSDHAIGMLLHPSIDETINEEVLIQGHMIRFVTVDLSQEAKSIREQLLQILHSDTLQA